MTERDAEEIKSLIRFHDAHKDRESGCEACVFLALWRGKILEHEKLLTTEEEAVLGPPIAPAAAPPTKEQMTMIEDQKSHSLPILCTFPGKSGDILWALPTVRAIARYFGERVCLMIPERFEGMKRLLEEGASAYIQKVLVNRIWKVEDTAPMGPWEAPLNPETVPMFRRIIHLGYRGWPKLELAEQTMQTALAQLPDTSDLDAFFDLEQPWLALPDDPRLSPYVSVGFSDEWVELKMGVLAAVAARFGAGDIRLYLCHAPGSRVLEWMERPLHRAMPDVVFHQTTWLQQALEIANSRLFFGCLSAPWVLANALGIPTVIMEPNSMRHHPIFWRESSKNHLVRGGGGAPTFDARHTGDELEKVWAEVNR